MMMRLSVSVGEENYHGAFDDDDPVYEGKKQSSANAWGNKLRDCVMQRSYLPPGMCTRIVIAMAISSLHAARQVPHIAFMRVGLGLGFDNCVRDNNFIDINLCNF